MPFHCSLIKVAFLVPPLNCPFIGIQEKVMFKVVGSTLIPPTVFYKAYLVSIGQIYVFDHNIFQ